VFGRKPVINFATPAGLGGRNTTVLLLAVRSDCYLHPAIERQGAI